MNAVAFLLSLALLAVPPLAVAQVSGVEGEVQAAARLLDEYGFRAAAIILSPFISWRLTQWVKLIHKHKHGYRPYKAILDSFSFLVVLGLSYWFWVFEADGALRASVIIASLHTCIVKAAFMFMPEKLAKAISAGVDTSDATVFHKTVIGVKK